MNESIGERIYESAKVEYQIMHTTRELSVFYDQQQTFVLGYLRGYLKAQDDVIKQFKERGK
jgi:hypothetical protein